MLKNYNKRKHKIGDVHGRLTLIAIYTSGGDIGEPWLHLCRCVCGNIREIAGASLTTGKTQSCGCLRNERVRAFQSKKK